jgi:hypothetical protein
MYSTSLESTDDGTFKGIYMNLNGVFAHLMGFAWVRQTFVVLQRYGVNRTFIVI